jgi:hypothetical protein
MGIKKIYTSAFHAAGNGQAERLNPFLAAALRCYTDPNDQMDWDDFLDAIAFAYRISVVNSIGFSPFFMLFARQPTLPTDVLYGSEAEIKTDLEKYSVRHTKIMRETYDRAIAIQKSTDAKKKEYYDKKHFSVEFSIGDKVLIPSKVRVSGLSKKLQQKNLGPFLVVEKTSDVNYKIRPIEGGEEKIVHVQRMILFKEGSLSSFDMDNSLGGEKQDSVTRANGCKNEQKQEFGDDSEQKSDFVDEDFEKFGSKSEKENLQTNSDTVNADFGEESEDSQTQDLNPTPEILAKRVNASGSWEFLVKTGLIQEWKKRGKVDRKLIKDFESRARANRSNRRSHH